MLQPSGEASDAEVEADDSESEIDQGNAKRSPVKVTPLDEDVDMGIYDDEEDVPKKEASPSEESDAQIVEAKASSQEDKEDEEMSAHSGDAEGESA